MLPSEQAGANLCVEYWRSFRKIFEKYEMVPVDEAHDEMLTEVSHNFSFGGTTDRLPYRATGSPALPKSQVLY